MRISPPVLAIGVLAAFSGWLVRGVAHDAEASPSIVTPAVVSAPIEEPLQIARPESIAHTTHSTRNLFAYVEASVIVKPAVLVAPPPPVAIVAPVVEPVPIAKPPRPRFAHHFIGSFGPAHKPIAAFARDGDVLTAAVGDRVGDFVIRAIRTESVDVERTFNGELLQERVMLTSSL